ncbi:hypothetical protein ACGH6Q_07605 [Gilliamella sp. BG2]
MKGEKFSKLMKQRTLKINDVLIALGYDTECYCDGCYEIQGRNDLFRVRVLPTENVVQIGIKKTFDRWANSVDAYFEIPVTVDQFKAELTRVTKLLRGEK